MERPRSCTIVSGDSSANIGVWGAVAFVSVMVIVGIPVWWLTTEVHRASLPHDKISSLGDRALNIHFALTMVAVGDSVQPEILDATAATLQRRLSEIMSSRRLTIQFDVKSAVTSARNFQASLSSSDKDVLVSQLLGDPDSERWAHSGDQHHSQYVWFILPSVEGRDSWVHLGEDRAFVSTLTEDLPLLVESVFTNVVLGSDQLEHHLDGLFSNLRSESASPLMYPQLSLEFYFPLRGGRYDKTSVFVAQFFSRLRHSFLQLLQPVLEVTVHSQVLYPSKGISSFTKSRSDAFVWGTESISDLLRQLDQFVLSSSGVNTTLFNFLVTGATDSSLSASKNTFAVIADWGGVAVLTSNPLLMGEDLFGGTVKQIRTLLQLDLGPSVINSQRNGNPILVSKSNASLSKWEVDRLSFHQLVKWTFSSHKTLNSLVDLLRKISNLVVNDDIAREVCTVTTALEEIFAGGPSDVRLERAKVAFLHAEKAFQDPSLLALLYFPEDQKYAIYVPLFLPAGVPVILSLKLIYKRYSSTYYNQ